MKRIMMNLVTRFEDKAIGIKLWKWNNTLVELWICKPAVVIPEHTHSFFDSWIILLFGWPQFMRDLKTRMMSSKDWFRPMKIEQYQLHGFVNISSWPTIFLNVEKWKTSPTSAAIDFNYL